MDHHTHYLSPPGHGKVWQELCMQFQHPKTMEFQATSNGSLSLTKTNTRWLMPHTFHTIGVIGESNCINGGTEKRFEIKRNKWITVTTRDMGSDHSPQALNAQFLGSSLKRVPPRSNNGEEVTLLWTWRAMRLSKEHKSCNWRMP